MNRTMQSPSGRVRALQTRGRAARFGLAIVAALVGVGCQVGLLSGDDPPPAGTTPDPVPACVAKAGPLTAQRLTKLEYNNVIRDLFGLTDDFSAGFADTVVGPSGFTTDSSAQNMSPEIVNDFYGGANAVVDKLWAQTPNPLLTCADGDACARKLISDLAGRAFRRPATGDEVDRLFALFKASTKPAFSDAMKLVVTGVLLSPQFIFRTYDLPDTTLDEVALTPYELASRLSFFLWGSGPDGLLLAAAADGTLTKDDVLRAQVKRMLKDSRASYLPRVFGAQWLGLDRLDAQSLDQGRYPLWSQSMQASMKGETLAFVDGVIGGDHSVVDFVSGKYTFVDANVSQIYGIPGDFKEFTRVDLPEHRTGVLTQPAVLSMSSHVDVTSPVKRGKWVLERILCSAPPPPPMNVPDPPKAPNGKEFLESQIREKMAAHELQGSSCKGCHSAMDPIGFSFESYDAIGAYRSEYLDGVPVDASGKLPAPTKDNPSKTVPIKDALDLADDLAQDARFPACFTEQLAAFGQGRDMKGSSDSCEVKTIAASSIGTEKTASEVIVAIVLGKSFRTRVVNR